MKKWKLATLTDAVENELKKMGYSAKTLQMYHYWGTRPIAAHYEARGEILYSERITNDCVIVAQIDAEAGVIPDGKRKTIRKMAVMLAEYVKNRQINWRMLPNIKIRCLTGVYADYLKRYERKMIANGFKLTTLRCRKPVAKHFLHYLEDRGITNTRKITDDDILAYVPVLSESYKRIGDAISVIRPFFAFLYEENLIVQDFSHLLKVSAANRREYHHGFTKDEAEKILSAVDRTTPCGKRDYAILLIATQTGLRAIDVLGLQFGNIDWEEQNINIVQHKTDKALVLPFGVAAGNAIADYILNGRPDSDSAYIFLRARTPHKKLESWSGHSIVKRAAKKAGVTWSVDEWKGFHSFRRSLGNWMLESEIPLSIISEILGHAKVDSSKPYIMTHHSKLQMCALTLHGIETARGELA